ncbi:uncharacterized protein LOC143180205 isoform X2 [Calliopsis andreniformis]|uniref:uncharacterized protein LOC143180204 isoform X2 n=1 Tax=Calliopsis andreniformis TaxID=337506 RepID=UPI003FCE9E85
MSVKHVRREYETRLFINTRTQIRNANGTTETNLNSLIRDEGFKNQKKEGRHNLITDTAHMQENSINENNSRNNVMRIERLDGLCSLKRISHVNHSNEAIHSPFTSRGKEENVRKVQPTVEPDVNSCTQKLVDVQTSEKLSKSLSSVKVHFVDPLKLSRLRNPTMRSKIPIRIPNFQLRNRSKLITNLSTQVSRPSFERSVKKPSLKYSVATKILDFLKIPKRIFAKSESIVDARRRLKEKHMTLITPVNKSTRARINLREKSKLLNESSNNLHNRSGLKIRKNDATNYILKKNSHSIRNQVSQQQQTRTILKGVRTNRRFELQMKARNINLK